MSFTMEHALQLRQHQRRNGDRDGRAAMDAVRQHIEGCGFATVITDIDIDHKSLILLNSVELLRKLTMTPGSFHLRNIKFGDFPGVRNVFVFLARMQ
jgi:hypothetical protein